MRPLQARRSHLRTELRLWRARRSPFQAAARSRRARRSCSRGVSQLRRTCLASWRSGPGQQKRSVATSERSIAPVNGSELEVGGSGLAASWSGARGKGVNRTGDRVRTTTERVLARARRAPASCARSPDLPGICLAKRPQQSYTSLTIQLTMLALIGLPDSASLLRWGLHGAIASIARQLKERHSESTRFHPNKEERSRWDSPGTASIRSS